MYFVNEFKVNQNKKGVFSKFKALLAHYPHLSLTYREGRRSNDAFYSSITQVNTVNLEKIQYSNEWKVFLNGEHEGAEKVNFHFIDDRLQEFSKQECKIKLLPKLTKEQLKVIKACQFFSEKIRNKILTPLEDDAWQKMGAAFSTTFCVVGKDMMRGLNIVEQAMNSIDKHQILSVNDFLNQLTGRVDELVTACEYSDSEGFIEGTAKEVVQQAIKLQTRSLKLRKSSRIKR